METLQIKKDDALKAHRNAKKSGKELLENLLGKKTFLKEVTERIKTIEDVLKDNCITQEELDKMFANAPEHLKYQYIAELLCKSLNEEWTPDWEDGNYNKYFPWFKMSSSGFRYDGCDYWGTFSFVGSRLCFKSTKLARYAGEQFTDVYRKFMII
ncbi:hypothetical protein [Leptobacterium sp. I13]|uniref:hypothetical protein n=1 Tax=Leptobacterium meishanense TaxID=3128904 RepID=UPI0030EEA29B